uniref:Helix-turn-helix domain protein n=1 Tax=Geobacillus sp. (strain Y4.1MC1) TaxID=581103 RepID=A0A7U3YCP7_GEOS0
MNILGKRLKYLREKFNYSQKKVAEAIGISNVQLSRYESGDRNPDPELIAAFADFYGVTTDYILGRTDDPQGYAPETNIDNIKDTKELNTLIKINELIKKYGIEQMGFFDIEKWKSLSEEEIEEIIKHFEWVVHKAKEKNKAAREGTED